MAWWNRMDGTRRAWLLIGSGLLLVAVVVACSMTLHSRSDKTIAGKGDPSVPDGSAIANGQSSPNHRRTLSPAVLQPPTPEQIAPPQPKSRQSLTEETLAGMRQSIETASGDSARVEARRKLLHAMRLDGRLDDTIQAFDALLADIAEQSGRSTAERAAMAEAGTIQGAGDPRTAIACFEQLLSRWPDSQFAAEALQGIGECQLTLRAYPAAEEAWKRIIEEFPDSPQGPTAWRKLALAQLLRVRFEESLATLEMMAGKYDGTEHGHYAKARRGYVLMVAGRDAEARKAYDTFLANCGQSKYCTLVQDQLLDLESITALAKADQRRK